MHTHQNNPDKLGFIQVKNVCSSKDVKRYWEWKEKPQTVKKCAIRILCIYKVLNSANQRKADNPDIF